MHESHILLCIESGPTNADIRRYAREDKKSEFIVRSNATGHTERVYVKVPDVMPTTTEIRLIGKYKNEKMRFIMMYYPESGTGTIRVFLAKEEN